MSIIGLAIILLVFATIGGMWIYVERHPNIDPDVSDEEERP